MRCYSRTTIITAIPLMTFFLIPLTIRLISPAPMHTPVTFIYCILWRKSQGIQPSRSITPGLKRTLTIRSINKPISFFRKKSGGASLFFSKRIKPNKKSEGKFLRFFVLSWIKIIFLFPEVILHFFNFRTPGGSFLLVNA